jgi:hypothetical protein
MMMKSKTIPFKIPTVVGAPPTDRVTVEAVP